MTDRGTLTEEILADEIRQLVVEADRYSIVTEYGGPFHSKDDSGMKDDFDGDVKVTIIVKRPHSGF